MFSRHLKTLVDHAERIGRTTPSRPDRVIRLLEKCRTAEGLSQAEVVELLNATRTKANQEVVKEMAAREERPRRAEILTLPPLYVSSKCENRCLYCNFSSRGGRLSLRQFSSEMDALLGMGYRSIELVSSQDPALFIRGDSYSPDNQTFDVGRAEEYFRAASERLKACGGGMLTSNIPPLDVKSLRRLKAAGLDCFLLWVETFQPGQYARLHLEQGPKFNQAFRLDSFEAALEAGIKHIAGAFLKGLYDWRKEEAVFYGLDRYLASKYGKGFSIIGTPRLKGPFRRSRIVKAFRVSDADYELNFALDRILFDGVLWLQTRETPAMNHRLIRRYGAGVILTLDCSTAPGGYGAPPKGKSQFPVYRQDLGQAVAYLEARGLKVVFDWTANTLSRFLRRRGDEPRR